MRRRFLCASLLALSLPLLQGCFPMVVAGAAAGVMSVHDRRTTGVQADDESLEWKISESLPASLAAQSHLNVTAYNRRVLLTGEAPTPEARAEIEALARTQRGVSDVFNELVVAAPSNLSARSRDSFLTSKIKARLVDVQQVSANHIKVVSEAGVAYLLGIVNEREAKAAIHVARTTEGVRKVVNMLEILPDHEVRRLDVARQNRSEGSEKR